MSLQELPRNAANGALKLVRLPVELATGARELIADRLGGDDKPNTETRTPFEPAKQAPPKPAAAKPKAASTKPKAASRPKPAAKDKPRRAAAKPKTARPRRTPSSKTPAAEEAAVVGEQTEGLEDATDRAIAERRGLR